MNQIHLFLKNDLKVKNFSIFQFSSTITHLLFKNTKVFFFLFISFFGLSVNLCAFLLLISLFSFFGIFGLPSVYIFSIFESFFLFSVHLFLYFLSFAVFSLVWLPGHWFLAVLDCLCLNRCLVLIWPTAFLYNV
jgi:hypothetical protein